MTLRALSLAVLLLSLPAAARDRAARGGLADEDRKALATYQLSEDKVNRVIDANQRLADALQKDPSLRQKLEAESPNREHENLAQAVKRLEAQPDLMKFIKGAGLSARDYLLTTFAFMQGAMVAGIQKAQPDTPVPEGVNPANVKYAQSHEKQLEQLQQAFQKAGVARHKGHGSSAEPEDEPSDEGNGEGESK